MFRVVAGRFALLILGLCASSLLQPTAARAQGAQATEESEPSLSLSAKVG
ncbi:MAG: hypothetical protein RL701_6033, partial [Pseudomonadota bacterium]